MKRFANKVVIVTGAAAGIGAATARRFADEGAAKGGVVNLTRTLAIDHAPDGIRVNAVCPGPVETWLTAAMARDADFMEEYRKLVPMARMAQPEEIAAAIVFLASDDASYITGHNLVVDGGVTAATGQPNFTRMFRERGWDQGRPRS